MEAVARARRRCRCGDERHRPPNRALLSYRPNLLAPICVAGPRAPGGTPGAGCCFQPGRANRRACANACEEQYRSGCQPRPRLLLDSSSSGYVGTRMRWLLLAPSGHDFAPTAGGRPTKPSGAAFAVLWPRGCGSVAPRATARLRLGRDRLRHSDGHRHIVGRQTHGDEDRQAPPAQALVCRPQGRGIHLLGEKDLGPETPVGHPQPGSRRPVVADVPHDPSARAARYARPRGHRVQDHRAAETAESTATGSRSPAAELRRQDWPDKSQR
jgi:hypothetical protein